MPATLSPSRSTIDLTGPGACYLRVSDDKQPIETQRPIIHDFEERHAVTIPEGRWYVDSDWSRDEHATRPDYNRMLKDAEKGKFKWVVIPAKDRFGHADHEAKLIDYRRLREAGVNLYTATGEHLNRYDLASAINAVVDGATEEKENRAKSERAIERMKQHAEAGKWMGGHVAPGLDVVCMDAKGQEIWRVVIEGRNLRVKISADGSRQRYDGKDNFPGRDKGHYLTLRPTILTERLDLCRDVFGWFGNESISSYQAATRLNQQRRPYPYGGHFRHFHVERMLSNPAYIGYPSWNRHSQGKWNQWSGGQRHEFAQCNSKQRDNDRSDWVTTAEAQFAPIVPIKLWEPVQRKLADKQHKPRAPKSGELWLAGLLYCAGCGQKMVATKRSGPDACYVCGSYMKNLTNPDGRKCLINSISHERAVEIVSTYLEEAGQQLEQIAAPVTHMTGDHGDRAVKSLAASIRAWRTMHAEVGKLEGVSNEDYDQVVIDLYRSMFESRRPELEASREELDRQHTNLTTGLVNLPPNSRAVTKVRAQLEEVEAELAEVEEKLKNAADEYDTQHETFNRLRREWEEARDSIADESSARSKADAIRKVISKVVVTFVPTGKQKPATYVSAVQIVAHSDSQFKQRSFGLPKLDYSIARLLSRSYVYPAPKLGIDPEKRKASNRRYRHAHRRAAADYAKKYRKANPATVRAARERYNARRKARRAAERRNRT